MNKIVNHTDHPRNVIVYGYPRTGSTLFLKLMEQALEQLDILPFMLKEFFANGLLLEQKTYLALNNKNSHWFLIKIFVQDVQKNKALVELLNDSDNLVVYMTRKNKYEGLISALRKGITHTSFGDSFDIGTLVFDPNDRNHKSFLNEYMVDIMNEHLYVSDNMVKIYFEDFIKDPIYFVNQFVEYKKPLFVPMEKQIKDYDKVFNNYEVLHDYIQKNYGLTKEDLINYVHQS